ncbi:MAG: two-component system response regulator GlrR, partial [Solirubrobacterales bacterium]
MIISDQKPTILLVEDGEDAAELIRRTVDSEGELTWVRTAEAGLECLLKGEWNLVLVDVELPGDKSLDFLQEARSRYPAL